MDELVDILDINGNLTGKTCLKSEAHENGLWHACIHVWLFTEPGEVLIQKRAYNKDTFPYRWDVSVAGHISASESPIIAAKRETFEEIGLKIKTDAFIAIGNYKTNHKHHENLIDKEFHYLYISKLAIPIEKLKLQVEEVAELKLISIEQLKKEVSDENTEQNYVPYSLNYFDMVFNAIGKEFQ